MREAGPLNGFDEEFFAAAATVWRRGLTQREFTLSRGDRPQRSVQYRWPFYRGRSGDFLSAVSEMVRSYG